MFIFSFVFLFVDMKFTLVARAHLADGLIKLRNGECGAKYSLKCLRPAVRGMILSVVAGERIPPEFIRIELAGCLKVASLKAVVHTLFYAKC